MTESKRFEMFEKAMDDLSTEDLISIYNDIEGSEGIFYFDADFFDTMFATKMDVARAITCGNVNWCDEYLRFNGYGNLVSLTPYDAREEVFDRIAEIYDHEDVWSQYIDIEDLEEEDDEEEDC